MMEKTQAMRKLEAEDLKNAVEGVLTEAYNEENGRLDAEAAVLADKLEAFGIVLHIQHVLSQRAKQAAAHLAHVGERKCEVAVLDYNVSDVRRFLVAYDLTDAMPDKAAPETTLGWRAVRLIGKRLGMTGVPPSMGGRSIHFPKEEASL